MWFSSLFTAKAFHYRDVEISTQAYYGLFLNVVHDCTTIAALPLFVMHFMHQSGINP